MLAIQRGKVRADGERDATLCCCRPNDFGDIVVCATNGKSAFVLNVV